VNNINNSVRGKTIIVAAHRLSTIMNADRILFIDDGLIMESGNHEELVELKGRYWKLVKNEM
jgi:ATP-binding cassette subfamily B protein